MILSATPAYAHQKEGQRKILVLGPSNSWGCVANCNAVQTENGYVKQLRLLLPDDEIRVQAWFGSGAADWNPDALPILDNALIFPIGVWEEGLGNHVNLWNLMAIPELCSWKPDYVITFFGWGDWLRTFRVPSKSVTTQEDYKTSMEKVARGILQAGAIPVLAVDGTGRYLTGYQASLFQICSDFRMDCGPDITVVLNGPYYGGDFFHPIALGHQRVAEAFADWFNERPSNERRKFRKLRKPRLCDDN